MMRHFGFVLVVALFSPILHAAQVTKVKGRSALINLQGTPASPGDTFYALDGGKKKALIRISKIKGDKAIGRIEKGNATAGMALSSASGGGGGSSSGSHASRDSGSRSNYSGGSSSSPSGRSYWGGMLGYGMDTMSVKVNHFTTGEYFGNASLSGSGFSAKALFDYELFPQVWFRGLGGLEMFNVAGDSICGSGNAQPCDAKIMYLSADFVGRYLFSMGMYRPWIGFGVSLMFPASKSATALSSESIGTTNVLAPQGGVDIFLSPTMYIPISIEYGMLPKSDEVDAKWMAVRVGMAVPF
ncbi:MAG: hypothetical protein KF799_12065 [Bdellovibrionales bacterium]|nr:hypothetical protein [Bdellovibrionales bacterium]